MPTHPPRLFGTDGIRGPANEGPLRADRVLALGLATAAYLRRRLGRPPRLGLGRDTRISSPALGAALTAGLSGGGAAVLDFGVLPTPAVSRLVRGYALDAGVVISASHNPAADNGIKYFAETGGKFPDAGERALERMLAGEPVWRMRTGAGLGPVRWCAAEAEDRYVLDLLRQYRRPGLEGMRLVIDTAHGATVRTASRVLQELGADVEVLNNRPDGLNINQGCGSLHPEAAARRVRRTGARAGLAFDGDGDRVMLIDETGRVVNGDRILGLLACHYAARGRLDGRTVVATVMSNLGLERFLGNRRIRLRRAPVGDRFVAQAMAGCGAILGGEQSGHILLPRRTPTGDGLVTALEVLSLLKTTGRPLSALAGGWSDYPQLLINVPVSQRPPLAGVPGLAQAERSAVAALGERGRVNLRYSGTELLARVMVEAETADLAETWAQRLAGHLETAIGTGKPRRVTWLTCA